MKLENALAQANEIAATVRPFCTRLEIAGSIRRSKPDDIKDIEIVAVPNNRLLFELTRTVNTEWGPPVIGAFPSKYTKIRGRLCIDFFWCLDPKTWGMLYWIRTGPAEYVANGLKHWKMISGGGKSEGCLLYDGKGTHIPTPEEEDVFNALQITWTEPCKRK